MTIEQDRVDELEAQRAAANEAGDKLLRNEIEGHINRMGFQLRDLPVVGEAGPETVAASEPVEVAVPKSSRRTRRG